jgi:tetratricopeptide (TPR) repeat protein
MIELRRMCNDVLGSPKIAGIAFLMIISNMNPAFAGLREEAAAYRSQGYEAQQRGDSTAAMAGYRKAAEMDPTYPTPHNDLGVLLEEDGRFEDAERAYLKALALNPEYLEPHANLAMLYERLGQREKAIFHWMKRYQLGEPNDAWTARAEERLMALGVLKDRPELKGRAYSRRRVADREFQAQAQSREEFRAITEEHGDWP